MSLIADLQRTSELVHDNKKAVRNEIIDYFKEKITAPYMEAYLRSRIGGDKTAQDQRRFAIPVWFWLHHSGCSGTNFFACGIKWEPTNSDDWKYKGVDLNDIHREVTNELCYLVEAIAEELGFRDIRVEWHKNNLGYAENKVWLSW